MPAMSDRPDIVDELREIASSAYKADDDNSRLPLTRWLDVS